MCINRDLETVPFKTLISQSILFCKDTVRAIFAPFALQHCVYIIESCTALCGNYGNFVYMCTLTFFGKNFVKITVLLSIKKSLNSLFHEFFFPHCYALAVRVWKNEKFTLIEKMFRVEITEFYCLHFFAIIP